MNKVKRAIRRFLLWARGWLRTSKPTEWLSSMSIFVSIVTAFIFLNSGFLDKRKSELEARKSELEARKSELAMANMMLEARRDSYLTQIKNLEAQVKERETALAAAKKDLSDSMEKLEEATAKLGNAAKRLDAYAQHESAVAFLSYLSKPSTVEKEGLGGRVKIAQGSNTVSIRIEGRREGKNAQDPLASKDTASVINALGKLRRLESLHIEGVQLEKEDLEAISKLREVRHLTLRRCGIDDERVSHLVLGNNVNILSLSENPIGKLPNIRELWAIQALNVSRTKVMDPSLSNAVKDLINCYSYRLERTGITDKTLDEIQRKQVDLGCINVSECKVTPDAVKRMIKRTRVSQVVTSQNEKEEEGFRKYLVDNDLDCEILFLVSGQFGEGIVKGKGVFIESPKQKNVKDAFQPRPK